MARKDDGTLVSCGTLGGLDTTTLSSFCSPAPFGDLVKMVTVIDNTVRTALECSLDKFELHKKGWCSNSAWQALYFMEEIKECIECILVAKEIELVPYKLNIYEKGGFFKPHVDTPIIPEKMIGTLIVCLPCKHTGGKLTVRHCSQVQEFDFSSNCQDIQWAAFYSDCVHEVEKVESGSRITVSFSILIDTKAKNDWSFYVSKLRRIGSNEKYNVGYRDLIEDTMLKALVESIQEDEMGMLLFHKYTQIGLSFENLKGVDAALVKAMTMYFDGKIVLLPIIYVCNTTYGIEENIFRKKEKIFAFGKQDMLYLSGGGGSAPKYDWLKKSDIPFVVLNRGTILNHKYLPGAEHTGNEARHEENDSIYLNAALICFRNKNK